VHQINGAEITRAGRELRWWRTLHERILLITRMDRWQKINGEGSVGSKLNETI